MRPFGQTSGTLRAIAALVSLALTAAVFLLLRATSAPAPARRTEVQVLVTVFPSPPVRRNTAPAPAAALPTRAGVRDRAAPRLRSTSSARRSEEEPAVAAFGPAASAAGEALAASAPLRIDAQTIARAIAGSEGPVRQMARRSGAELDTRRASRSQALAGTIEDTGVGDCLAPNAGGSLLSAPILLLLALQGKCK